MRAAFIKYANNAELPTLAEKLDHMFKTKLLPNACKTKIKSSDEEVSHINHKPYCSQYRKTSNLQRKSWTSTPNNCTASSDTLAARAAKIFCKKMRPFLLVIC